MAKKAKPVDPVHIDVIVKATKHDIVRHAGKCPISNTLADSEPGEILHTKTLRVRTRINGQPVEMVEIRFSRRSTDTRYVYRTAAAVKFLDKWDSGNIPGHFRLLLKQSHLYSSAPRSHGNSKPQLRRKTGPKRQRTSNIMRPLPTKPATGGSKKAA